MDMLVLAMVNLHTRLKYAWLWPPYEIGGHYIFALRLLSIFLSFFSSPNISGRRLDVYHTSIHGVALVRI